METKPVVFYVSKVLLLLAVLAFVLVAFGVGKQHPWMLPAGLASFASAFLLS